MGYSPYQLVQDFFHQQYDMKLVESLPETLGITKGMLGVAMIVLEPKKSPSNKCLVGISHDLGGNWRYVIYTHVSWNHDYGRKGKIAMAMNHSCPLWSQNTSTPILLRQILQLASYISLPGDIYSYLYIYTYTFQLTHHPTNYLPGYTSIQMSLGKPHQLLAQDIF